MKNLLTVLALAVIFSSCEKVKPEAGFTFSGGNCKSPCTITFTNTSVGAETYFWDFGDSTPFSTEANPSHTYTKGGNYKVTLVVSGSNGIDNDRQTVPVTPYPTKVTVTKISLFNFPPGLYDEADSSDGPDLYVIINGPSPAGVYWRTLNSYPDKQRSDLPLHWPSSCEITDFKSVHNILLFDNDFPYHFTQPVDDRVWQTSVQFNNYADSAPGTVTLKDQKGEIKLDLVWEY